MVIPVTSRFLRQPSRARDVEFGFATKQCRIPVLPLTQEPGLEAEFNQKRGNLQILGRDSLLDQEKALAGQVRSYQEKLAQYLSSVLVGDQLAAKVRAAFDAYIFLSYRKKNRKYVQELMPLIHKNDFCRDIAIWYDEFLVPGENFNQAIADAMERCQLFTLAVTSNLTEPDNYVMTTEYPKARETGKPILPIELVPTDQEALRGSFRDIPPCTDGYDQKALSALLLEAAQRLAIRENDCDPQHNFFIGLAYLNGIDMEVDRKRAIDLITRSAEDGLPEAMEKLADMYSSGTTVERDCRAAAHWQSRLTQFRQTRFAKSRSEQDGMALMTALFRLGHFQHMSNNPCMVKAVSGLSEYDLSVTGWKDADLAGAEKSFPQVIEVSGQLYDLYNIQKAREFSLLSFLELGDICQHGGRPDRARYYYLQAWNLCQELEAAEEHYQEASDLFRQLWEETKDLEALKNLAVCYEKLGDIVRDQVKLFDFEYWDPYGTEHYYQEAVNLFEQVWEAAKTP